MKKINEANNFAALVKSAQNAKYAPISKSVCAAMLAGAMVLGGGVFVSTPAYADGYVDGTGNNIYYGYKTDASYSEARFHIEVDYYDTLDNAKAGGTTGKDPLGKFVRVHYLSNCAKKDGTADDWRFRPMWWYGVPKGLQDVQDITYTRVEKLTNQRGNQPFKPAGSSQFKFTNAEGYGIVSQKTYNKPEDWNNISNFYFKDSKVLASKGWKQLLGLNGGSYDKVGNTESQWDDYKNDTAGLQGIFVDWESAGTRYYDMTYVAEMTQDAWEKRDEHPLRFVAGVYRFAGNWHYAAGQKHNTPKIADHLTIKYPDVTLVKDLNKLNNGEKGKVKKAIEDANRGEAGAQTLFDKLVKDDQDGIVINDNGSATITFKDNTKRTIPASILVAKDESDSDKYKPKMPERTPVVKPDKLTDEDKKTVIAAFKEKNKDNKGFNDNVKADPDGIKFDEKGEKLVITYKDGSKLEIPASELVYQGATIADWAPYVVPDTITVDNLKQLKQDEINKIVSAFDTANQGITPYDEAKAQNGNNVPVTVDASTGAATITWKDGSTTTIEAWQYLKEKAKQTPEPPAPAEAKKEFKVTPTRIFEVNFNPFKTSQQEITTAGANNTQLTNVRNVLAGYAKDAESGSAVSGVTVEYGVDSTGAGTVTFKANGYNDKTYPMSMFFKQKAEKQEHTNTETPVSTSDSQDNIYFLRKYPIAGENPTPQEKNGAAQQFVTDNYDGTAFSCTAGKCHLTGGDNGVKPKSGTKGLIASRGGSTGISYIQANDNDTITFLDNRDNVLTTIKNVYLKNQTPKDNTFDQLKKQALALWNQKKTDGLTDRDFKRVGITDPSKYPDVINSMTDSDANKAALRELIQQLYNAKKITRKYNNPADVEVENASNPTDEDFKKAIKAFLDANYTGAGDVNSTTYSMTSALKPKSSTADMEPYDATKNPVGITTISKGTGNTLTVTCKDNTTFTVSVTFKKKAAPEPAPKPGEKSKLDKMKEKAKEVIERNPNLTPEQKKQFKKQVDDAHDANGVNTALNNANEKGKKNKNNTSDPSIQRQISNNKQGTTAQQQADEDQKKKDKEEREKKQKQQLQTDKTNAENTINNMPNLSEEDKSKLKAELNGDSTPAHPEGAKTPEAVKKILEKAKAINDAKGALQNDIKKGALPFLDHGKGGDADKTDPDHADDAALNELLGTKSGKDATLTALDNALKADNATADSINTALNAAKRQNTINEANAKAAANAKLDALLQKLTDAENGLNAEQKAAVKDKVEAAKNAITTAQGTVKGAKKPSEIKSALDGVKIDDALKDINTQVSNAQKNNVKDPSQTQNGQLDEEKKAQTKRIQDSDLPEADKQKAIKDINDATKSGDPTAIANRYLKAKKIEDALKKVDEFKHLNKAQKDAFKAIINGTDAGNHTNDDGTTSDDIDDALANATATDAAMARLETLKKTADKFAQGEKYKALQDGDAKKEAFKTAATAAGSVLDKANGDAKSADQVNDLYKDLLTAMQAIDKTVKGAGVSTDALQAEVDNDSKFKPTQADPTDPAKQATPGNPIYNTSSQAKKDAFDQALTAAEAALNTAKEDNANQAKPNTTPRTPEQEAQAQQAVDTALQNLQKAREELDGVDTKPLQDAVAKADDTKKNVKYTNATNQDKRDAYDKAIKEGQELLDKLNGNAQAQPGQGGQQPGGQQPDLSTKKAKQKALDAALKKIQDAYDALDGKAVEPEPIPTPTPSDVDKTDLAAEIALDSTIGRRMSYIVSPSDKQLAYDRALSKARAVYADPSATQDEVNAAVAALRAAARALSGYGSVDNDVNPLPTPSPVPGGSGFGVNDNAPTTVDKGELNVQIDSAEADSQPGNAGAGNNNAGNNNAGNANANAADANNNAANGANSAAVNAAVENSPAVKQADAQVAKAQAALDSALAEAKKVAADPNATQAQVDAAAQKLSAARKALAEAKAHAAQVRASVRAQVLKSGVSKLSKTGSNVSVFGLLATVAAAGAAFFVSKRRGISRHSNN